MPLKIICLFINSDGIRIKILIDSKQEICFRCIFKRGCIRMVREPYAKHFYPGDCRSQIETFLKNYRVPEDPVRAVGGIVPHAGWVFSGAVAAKVFKSISVKTSPDTFILLGAVHTSRPRNNSLYAHGSWSTPFGDVKVDSELSELLLSKLDGNLIDDPEAHTGEHSVEVQTPLIKYLCPEAMIVPIAVLPDEHAPATGRKIGEIAASQTGKKIVVVGTTDLTHYGDSYYFTPFGYGEEAKEKMKENDSRIIELMLAMKSGDILNEVTHNQNACGPGAIAAAIEASKALGAEKGYLLEYTTSHDVMPEREFEMAVGYAGILF
jgi:MEMO1 family protein